MKEYDVPNEEAHYALEGSISIAGAAVAWLRYTKVYLSILRNLRSQH